MNLSKFKHRLFAKSSMEANHDSSDIIGASSDGRHAAQATTHPSSTVEGSTANTKWSPWMPKEPLTEPLEPSNRESQKTKNSELTEKEMELERRLGVSDAEKQAAAEERRAHVRAYLRDNRDKHRYMMGGGF